MDPFQYYDQLSSGKRERGARAALKDRSRQSSHRETSRRVQDIDRDRYHPSRGQGSVSREDRDSTVRARTIGSRERLSPPASDSQIHNNHTDQAIASREHLDSPAPEFRSSGDRAIPPREGPDLRQSDREQGTRHGSGLDQSTAGNGPRISQFGARPEASSAASPFPDKFCVTFGDSPLFNRLLLILLAIQEFVVNNWEFLLTILICLLLIWLLSPVRRVYQCINRMFGFGVIASCQESEDEERQLSEEESVPPKRRRPRSRSRKAVCRPEPKERSRSSSQQEGCMPYIRADKVRSHKQLVNMKAQLCS
jgi:hypothetical protein